MRPSAKLTTSILALLLAGTTLLAQTGSVFRGLNGQVFGGGGTATFQTGGVCNSGGFTCVINTTSISVTAGWNAVVLVNNNSNGTNSVTDTDGDTFTSCAGPLDSGTTPHLISQLFCVTFANTNASEAITVHTSLNTNFLEGAAVVYSGSFTVVDKASTTNVVNATCTSGATATLSTASELIVGACVLVVGPLNTFTAGAGYTIRQHQEVTNTIALQDKMVAATTAVTSTMTNTDDTTNYNGLVVTLHQ